MEAALKKAKEEHSKAIYLEECGGNAGLRKMNANKSKWLKWVIYLAELGLETEKILAEQDKLLNDGVINEQPTEACELKSNFQQVMGLFQVINNTKLE